jgi:hypothetical protein
MSEVALSTYQSDIWLDWTMLGLYALGRNMFSNWSIPASIHFNSPRHQKAAQMEYAKWHFPLIQQAQANKHPAKARIRAGTHQSKKPTSTIITRALPPLLELSSLALSPSTHEQDFLFDWPICTGLGDRVGVMLTLAALARHHNTMVGYLWCKDPSVIYSCIHSGIPRWSGHDYNLNEFKARFRPPSRTMFVSDLADPSLQRLPKVVWGQPGQGEMPFPAEHGSDSIPNIAWLTMRLPVPAKVEG